MQLPTFIGIGTPKSGSTWLYDLLKAHPQIWISDKRAEIRFFDDNYEKGLSWYEQFFPKGIENKYLQYGEFSPQYLYSKEAIQRIHKLKSVEKLIICCRNPVERAFSHYKFFMRIYGYKGSFQNFFVDYPFMFDRGIYSKPLENVLKYFSEESILLLTFEDLFQDIEETKKKLANFLEVDVEKFPVGAGHKKINQGFMPKYGGLYNFGIKTGRVLRKYDLYKLEHFIKNSGLKTLLSRKGVGYQDKKRDRETKLRLYDKYREEFDKLEKTTTLDVQKWRVMEEQLKKKSVEK